MAVSITKPTTASIFGTDTSDDFLLGSAGDDVISGGVETIVYSVAVDGVDTMEGGLGDDKYIVNDTTDVITEYAGEGTDTVFTTVSYTLATELENIVAAAVGTSVAGITLTGNAKDNVLDGSQSTDLDTLVGGGGNDLYILGTDDIVNADTSGVDTVQAAFTIDISSASATTNFAANAATVIENVTLTAAGSDDSDATDADITGNTLNNRLTGNSGDNNIIGANGNDILDTGAANTDTVGTVGGDTLDGGAGNDTYIIRSGVTATLIDASGTDKVFSFATVDLSSNTIENVTLLGSVASLEVTGNALNNVLVGNSAGNTISGGAGKDTLNGGGGSDTLEGEAGDDVYIVDSGDTVTEIADEGADSVQFSGTSGTFTVGSHVEKVTITSTAATRVTASSSTTNITITGNAADNTLIGGSGNDSLSGGAGDDALTGNNGNDTMVGGTATTLNTYAGGAGNDVYIIVDEDDTITEGANKGTDTVQFAGAVAGDVLTVSANVEAITITGSLGVGATATGSTKRTMTGNAGNNSLTGGTGNDIINGNAGSDTLSGGTGNDSLNGGTGNDSMVGGAGNDKYFVDSLSDTVDEVSDSGAGTDTVETTVSYTQTDGDGIEILTLAGSAANGTGNASNNTINGNSSANTLSGLVGADTINGGGGNDTITGGTGRDVVTTGANSDKIVFATGVTDTVATATSIAGVDWYKDLAFKNGGVTIDLTVTVANIGTAVSGTLDEGSFVADINALVTDVDLDGGFIENNAGIDAAIVTANDGDLSGQKFLVVDLDASDTFTATDFVIEITGSVVTTLTTAAFV